MWLYTSNAVQPHRSVASKNGDLRYHGPKYKVLEVTSGIAPASPLTRPPSSRRRCPRRAGPPAPPARAPPGPPTRPNRYSTWPIAQVAGAQGADLLAGDASLLLTGRRA